MSKQTKKTDTRVKLKLRKGDMVTVIAGNHKGSSGRILQMLPERQRVIVEGVNVVSKHVKPSASNPEGGINKTEASIHISNLMLIDPSSGEPTRVGRKTNDEGKLQRYSKKSGEFIKNG